MGKTFGLFGKNIKDNILIVLSLISFTFTIVVDYFNFTSLNFNTYDFNDFYFKALGNWEFLLAYYLVNPAVIVFLVLFYNFIELKNSIFYNSANKIYKCIDFSYKIFHRNLFSLLIAMFLCLGINIYYQDNVVVFLSIFLFWVLPLFLNFTLYKIPTKIKIIIFNFLPICLSFILIAIIYHYVKPESEKTRAMLLIFNFIAGVFFAITYLKYTYRIKLKYLQRVFIFLYFVLALVMAILYYFYLPFQIKHISNLEISIGLFIAISFLKLIPAKKLTISHKTLHNILGILLFSLFFIGFLYYYHSRFVDIFKEVNDTKIIILFIGMLILSTLFSSYLFKNTNNQINLKIKKFFFKSIIHNILFFIVQFICKIYLLLVMISAIYSIIFLFLLSVAFILLLKINFLVVIPIYVCIRIMLGLFLRIDGNRPIKRKNNAIITMDFFIVLFTLIFIVPFLSVLTSPWKGPKPYFGFVMQPDRTTFITSPITLRFIKDHNYSKNICQNPSNNEGDKIHLKCKGEINLHPIKDKVKSSYELSLNNGYYLYFIPSNSPSLESKILHPITKTSKQENKNNTEKKEALKKYTKTKSNLMQVQSNTQKDKNIVNNNQTQEEKIKNYIVILTHKIIDKNIDYNDIINITQTSNVNQEFLESMAKKNISDD